jgi:hypothetical protein
MSTSPTDALDYANREAESVLFLLAAFADLSDDVIEIDGGPRLCVFETNCAVSRASDLARLQ